MQHVHYVPCGREILSAVGGTAKAIFARELLKPIFASVERDPSPWIPALLKQIRSYLPTLYRNG